jgi:hypothetical protein
VEGCAQSCKGVILSAFSLGICVGFSGAGRRISQRSALRASNAPAGIGRTIHQYGPKQAIGLQSQLRGVFQIAQLRRTLSHYPCWMRMGDMNPKLVLAVPCPTCGVAVGKGCVLHSGQPRNDPHLDRKLCAIEALESKRAPALGGRSISDQNMSKWVEVIERERK